MNSPVNRIPLDSSSIAKITSLCFQASQLAPSERKSIFGKIHPTLSGVVKRALQLLEEEYEKVSAAGTEISVTQETFLKMRSLYFRVRDLPSDEIPMPELRGNISTNTVIQVALSLLDKELNRADLNRERG